MNFHDFYFTLLSWVFAGVHYPSRGNKRSKMARGNSSRCHWSKFRRATLRAVFGREDPQTLIPDRASRRPPASLNSRCAPVPIRPRTHFVYFPFIAPRSIKTPSPHRADLVTPFLGTTKRFQDHHHDERLRPVDPGQARAPPSWLQARRASRPRRIRDARRHLRSPSHQNHRQVHAGLGAPGGWARPRENFSIRHLPPEPPN